MLQSWADIKANAAENLGVEADGRQASVWSSVVRVTYLLSDLGGGTGHHLLDLLAQRDLRSWEADIVSEVPSTARMEVGVEHRVLDPPPGPARYPIRQARRYRQLERQLRLRQPPDLLHTFFFWSIIYGRLLKVRGLVPRLVENREDQGFDWGMHEYALLALTRHVPDRVICVSEAVRQVVLEREGIRPSRVEVIRNGIVRSEDMNAARGRELRAELGLSPAHPVVLMVANYDRPVKGVRYFLESIPIIRDRLPATRFILLGTGKTEPKLRQRAAQLGIDDVLLLPGFRDDVQRFYGIADISVLTSLSEGLSITLLESMRYGVPIVATDVGGNPEIVAHGRSGWLVPPRDPERFATAVIRLLLDDRLRRQFGAAGRHIVERDFDIRRVVSRYGEIYRRARVNSQP